MKYNLFVVRIVHAIINKFLKSGVSIIITFIKKLLSSKKQSNKKNKAKKTGCNTIGRSQHNISKTDISVNSLKVLNRLGKGDFDAYLVGGSVRDLLLHKTPKDFDVATNAKPNEVRKLFKNCRIIGRRFRLAHILFYRDIIEVATFRSTEPASEQQKVSDSGMIVRDNVYGTIEEDAWRRDFTLNALYYDIRNSTILDFTGGFDDIKNKTIRIIGDANERFREDPVRMLRAIRFAAKLDFQLCDDTAQAIAPNAHLLTNVSNSRLFDEVAKLYHCGNAVKVQQLLQQHGLFQYLFPQLENLANKSYPLDSLLHHALENTDSRINENRTVTPSFFFAVLLWFPVLEQAIQYQHSGIPPLPAFEKAVSFVISQQNKTTSIPKRFTSAIREMWILQYRFPKRFGIRPFKVLEHPRFRAAYDFLLLRALAGDESVELAEWWSAFQEAPPHEQRKMIKQVNKNKNKQATQ